MVKDFPSDILIPEFEYYIAQNLKYCAFGNRYQKNCSALAKNIEAKKIQLASIYSKNSFDINQEYRKLCGSNWGYNYVITPRCDILMKLGAESPSVKFQHVLVADILIVFVVFCIFNKRKNNITTFLLSFIGLVGIGAAGAILSTLGVFFALNPAFQLIPMLFSVPIVGSLFFRLFESKLSKSLNLIIAIIFALATNYYVVSEYIIFPAESLIRSNNIKDWKLKSNITYETQVNLILNTLDQ